MENMTKADIIAKYARGEGDTGSPEVQVALLTDRIAELEYTEQPVVNLRNQ